MTVFKKLIRVFSVSACLLLVTAVLLFAQNPKIDSLSLLLKNMPEDTARAKVLHELCYECMASGDYAEGLNQGNNCVTLSEKLKYPAGLISGYNSMGNIYEELGNYPMAMENYLKAFRISKKNDRKENLLVCYNNMGNIYASEGNYQKAMEQHNEALKIAESTGNRNGMSICYNNIGNVYEDIGDNRNALAFYNKSLGIKVELNDKRGIAKCYNNIGLVYLNQSNFPKALDYYTKSLKISEEIGDKAGISKRLNNIGNIYLDQSNFDKALYYYSKSLKITEELNDMLGISIALNNLGGVYSELKNWDKTLECYNKSLRLSKEMDDKSGMSICYNNLGTTFMNLKDYVKARESFSKSLSIRKEIGDQAGVASTLVNFSNLNNTMGNFLIGKNQAGEAVAISDEIGAKSTLMLAFEQLAISEYGLGNYKEAYQHFKKFKNVTDSVFNLENSRQLSDIKTNYEVEKKETELKAANRVERAKKDAQLKQQKMLRNFFVAGFILMLLLALVIFRSYRRKQRDNQIIHRQKEIVEKEKQRSEGLLLNILPEEIAEELKEKGEAEARLIPEATVLFTDFKGFTALSEKLSPKQLVKDLHECFSAFDRIVEKYNLEKIKTIGDSYMAAGGLPVPHSTHAADAVKAALEMRNFIEQGKAEKQEKGQPFFEVRIGIHTGPVVAGIVGIKKFAYDIWGDTVNTASRMESSGEAGKVNISETTYALVKNEFTCTSRGKISAKGKGEIEMYFAEIS